MATTAVKKSSVQHAHSHKSDEFAIIKNIQQGIKYEKFAGISNKISLGMRQWVRVLHITERTLQRYKKTKKTFDSLHSEKILEIAYLYEAGKDIFGSMDKFNSWLHIENLSLGGKKPIELINTNIGITMLRNELGRIEYGILA